MQSYIGVKQVQACTMTRGEFTDSREGATPTKRPNNDDPGYLVVYPDGYESWCPKAQFEAANFPLECENGSSIRPNDVARFMGEPTVRQIDPKTALVSVESLSGFVQHEPSSCVDPANYDEEIAREIGTSRLRERFWGFLGFVLQWSRFGLRIPEVPTMSLAEVAEAYSCCPDTVRKMIEEGTLAGIPVTWRGRQTYRVLASDVETLLPVRRVAELLGIDSVEVRTLIRTGALPARGLRKDGRACRVRQIDVVEHLARRDSAPEQPELMGGEA